MSGYVIEPPYAEGLAKLRHRLAQERRAETLRRIARVAAASRAPHPAQLAERASSER